MFEEPNATRARDLTCDITTSPLYEATEAKLFDRPFEPPVRLNSCRLAGFMCAAKAIASVTS
jgi:hypothetical protein